MKAICIKCGGTKRMPSSKCPNCKFTPIGKDMVKSVYCSTARFGSDETITKQHIDEIIEIQIAIRKGESIIYEEAVLERLAKEQEIIDSISPVSVWLAVLKFFLPAIIFLGFLYAIIFIFKK
jgi:hypothetical protein